MVYWSSQYAVDTTSGFMTNRTSSFYDVRSPQAELVGNATVVPCSGCDNGDAVGYIGYQGKFLLKKISGGSTGGLHSALISYANGDTNWRYATLRVTSTADKWGRHPRVSETNVSFPSTGGGQSTKSIVVQLELVAGQMNNFEIGNESGYGPDIDYIKVETVD